MGRATIDIMVKITGWYQLPGDLPRQVDFKDLFDTAFMRKCTKYRSFEKFLAGGKFDIQSQADFEALPEAEMDAHVRRMTQFASWKEMIDTATDIYARRAAGRK